MPPLIRRYIKTSFAFLMRGRAAGQLRERLASMVRGNVPLRLD
jgi:hypothetical protein